MEKNQEVSVIIKFWPNRIPRPYQKTWKLTKFVFIHCKTVKVSQNDQIRL